METQCTHGQGDRKVREASLPKYRNPRWEMNNRILLFHNLYFVEQRHWRIQAS